MVAEAHLCSVKGIAGLVVTLRFEGILFGLGSQSQTLP